ncbi:MAG TPA: TlpA disulfide reductase family protein [Mycobacterium sp.]|nr:TlpA disulfide reductase family protein [Mycobacterium sp.]
MALLGSAAPEIEVADWVLGQPTTLAEQHGKVLLLEFWARWCRPCLAMFPVLRELHSRYAECGLTIAALTRYVLSPRGDPIADRVRQRDAICQTVAGRGLEIAVGIAPDRRLQQKYGATGIPAFALVDHLGIVRSASPMADKAELGKAIADLLHTPM